MFTSDTFVTPSFDAAVVSPVQSASLGGLFLIDVLLFTHTANCECEYRAASRMMLAAHSRCVNSLCVTFCIDSGMLSVHHFLFLISLFLSV